MAAIAAAPSTAGSSRPGWRRDRERGLFYPPAFAALTACTGRAGRGADGPDAGGRVREHVFAPLTQRSPAPGLARPYLALAVVLAAVTVLAHAFFLRLPWPRRRPLPGHPARRGADRSVLGSRTFLLLVAAATLCAFAQYAALVNLVPLLHRPGHDAGLAAWALGLAAPGRSLGGCAAAAAPWLGTRGRTVAIIAAVGAATLLLGLLPGPAALPVAASLLAGAVRGVFRLTEATLVTDYWGPGRYAAVNGVFNAPLTAAGAIAPSIGAAVAAAVGSYPSCSSSSRLPPPRARRWPPPRRRPVSRSGPLTGQGAGSSSQ